MAQSFTAVPGILTFTVGASDVATKVNLPNYGRRVTVLFETDEGKLALTGTDAAAIDSNHFVVEADRYFTMVVAQDNRANPTPIYVATSAGSTTVRVSCEVE